MVQEVETLLRDASDGRFADPASVALMLTAVLGGSVRTVMETHASAEDLAVLRRELPRVCGAYLALAS